ncbi:hypothetical protein EVG20_g11445 [Dentipellis fragilis]|uniref:Uncharacterized protein n=1 Tax=Dentipellis fragilis TaxID=205917 RepID=A0A4Y9XKR6_9AGAM|nr:hypothetical protein EVG20_g11445 [Dentipellis fragilis]
MHCIDDTTTPAPLLVARVRPAQPRAVVFSVLPATLARRVIRVVDLRAAISVSQLTPRSIPWATRGWRWSFMKARLWSWNDGFHGVVSILLVFTDDFESFIVTDIHTGPAIAQFTMTWALTSERIPEDLLQSCIRFAHDLQEARYAADDNTTSQNLTNAESASPDSDPVSADPHAVSKEEASRFYADLASRPTLIYRSDVERKWESRSDWQRKELRPVFGHSINKVWNDDLSWKVVGIMDFHKIRFTTIEPVRFREYDWETGEDGISPVVIWVGVHPGSGVSASTAHDASMTLLALLKDFDMTDVHVHFRESSYIRTAGAPLYAPVNLLDPTADVHTPLTPALGVGISTMAHPDVQGTMALYLAAGGDSQDLLGLSCRHVLIGPTEANEDYVSHIGTVVLLCPPLNSFPIALRRIPVPCDRELDGVDGSGVCLLAKVDDVFTRCIGVADIVLVRFRRADEDMTTGKTQEVLAVATCSEIEGHSTLNIGVGHGRYADAEGRSQGRVDVSGWIE